MNITKGKVNWGKIGLSNDFLFGKVMRDLDLCRELLRRILPDLKIDHVEYSELQKSIHEDADAKSVRLDLYLEGDQTVYDIEMQATDTKELPKRSRYYQSMMDLQLVDKGQSYSKLNDSYVIFICLMDLFQQGRHQYTFEYRCREDPELVLEDGTTKIFLNANGRKNDVREELKVFLDYVAGGKPGDTFTERLDEAVRQARKNREWRHEYMTLQMRDQVNLEKGLEQGLEQGIKRGIRQGRKEGLKVGREKGRAEGREEVIRGVVSLCRDLGLEDEVAVKQLKDKFHLSEKEAKKYLMTVH